MKTLIRSVVHWPRATLALLVLFSLLMAWPLPHLRIETSLQDLVIQDLPESAEYAAFRERFGNEEIILVAMRGSQSVFAESTFALVRQVSEALTMLEGVDKVVSLPELRKAMDITESWDDATFEQIIAPVTLLDRNLIASDRKTTTICLFLKDIKNKEALIGAIENVLRGVSGQLTVYQVGIPLVAQALEQCTLRDFKTLPLITLVIIAGILFVCFRSFWGVMVPMAAVLLALLWTFGLMAWTDTPISMVTMIAPILTMAVGTAYALYIMAHYFDLSQTDRPTDELVVDCLHALALPTFITSLTTIIGFASLLVSRIDSIQQFAFFSCAGIVSIVVCGFSFIPATLVLLPRPACATGRHSASGERFKGFLRWVIAVNCNHQKITMPVALVLTVVSAIGLTRIHVETDALACLKADSPVRQRFHDIYRDVAGSSPVNVVLTAEKNGYWEELESLRLLERVQGYLDTLEGVDKSISWLDYLKLTRYATNQYQAEYYAVPQFDFEVGMGRNTLSMMLGSDTLQRFVDSDARQVNLLLRTHLCSSRSFLETKRRILDHLAATLPRGVSAQVTGMSVAIAHSAQTLTMGQVSSLSTSLVLIFIVMVLLFMSWRVGAIAVLPNLFPIAFLFGFMGWLNIELSLVTSLIASIAIGITVDDTVHYLTTYNMEFKKDWDKHKAMERTILAVGEPITVTSVCLICGFSVLMLSSFRPTVIFGLLMGLTMVSDMFCNLFLMPSIMLHFELVTVWDLLRVRLGKALPERIPLFRGMSRHQVRHVLWAGFLEKHGPGAVVFRKDDPADSMYSIISGEVKVVDESGKHEHVIATLKAGDVFGEMGMIRSKPRNATVVSTTETELLKINHRMTRRLQRLFPPTACKFFHNLVVILCDRLECTTQRFLKDSEVREG